jgi:carboxyl-terminal processing protease
VDLVRRGKTEPQPLDLPRAVIAMQHLTADKIDDDVAYVRLPTFGPGVSAELREKLQQFQQKGVHKLVLDLRDCASGPMSEGISAAQLFVPSGTIAVLSGQTVTRQEFAAAADKVVWRDPVEVLISDSTSGAAEVVASALGGNHRGDLVGRRTFGSASEQKVIPLEDGAALVLTVGYYYTPAGKPIIDAGVPATVEVNPAIPDLTDDSAETPAPLSTGQLPSHDDPVVRKALDLLKADARKAA